MGFAGVLLKMRKDQCLSLREAAARIGISHTYLSALEKGADPRTGEPIVPSDEVLIKWSRAYGIEYAKLIAYFGIRENQDAYIYMAHQLHALKKSDPGRFREILEIIYKD